jgi:hypothetical protein
LAALPLLAGCLPSTKFNVSVRVIDEETGKPIPDAWVFVAAYVQARPAFEPPYDKPLAGTRVKTNADGIAYLTNLEGLSYRGEPKDKLWKMLDSMNGEPKRRKIVGVEGGNVFVLARGYGAMSQAFAIKDNPSYQAKLKKNGRYDGVLWMGTFAPFPTIELDSKELAAGHDVTLKMRKPADPERLKFSFCPMALETVAWIASSKDTGASMRDKRAIYDYILHGVADLGEDKAFESCGHGSPAEWSDATMEKDFLLHDLSQSRESDASVNLWMTQKSIELLPPGYDEVKQHMEIIKGGVVAEGTDARRLNHFYNPYDPESTVPRGQQALKWAAIGYPDNPANEWGWQAALRYYREGDIGKAYKALGQVLSVLEDLSVPMQTHGFAQNAAPDSPEAGFETFFSTMARQNFGNLPSSYSWEARAPANVTDVKSLFDAQARLTFGKFVREYQEINFDDYYGLGGMRASPVNATLELMGGYLFPKAIANGAGLMQYFYDSLHPKKFVQAPQDKTGKTDASANAPSSQQGPPLNAQPTNGQKEEASTPLGWEKKKGLERHLMLSKIKGSRKITIHPAKQKDGITRGLVIAYGHVIPSPYNFVYQGRTLYVNGVQLSPSMFDKEDQATPLTPEEERADARLSKVIRQAREIYAGEIETKPLGQVQADVATFINRSTDVFKNPIWDSNTTLGVSLTDHPGIPFQIGFGEHLPPQRSPDEAKRFTEEQDRSGKERDLDRIKGQLEIGHSIMFLSEGGRSGNADIRPMVNAIMNEKDLTREQRIEKLHDQLHDYDAAIDITDNYDTAEWKVK